MHLRRSESLILRFPAVLTRFRLFLQSIIHFGKIARKHKLSGVCLESLNRIYTITSVPIVDCFQKIRQQIKCYVQLSTSTNKSELQEGLEVINSTNVKCFPKEMTAEFYALKGLLYQLSSTNPPTFVSVDIYLFLV